MSYDDDVMCHHDTTTCALLSLLYISTNTNLTSSSTKTRKKRESKTRCYQANDFNSFYHHEDFLIFIGCISWRLILEGEEEEYR
jgi:hypothetical protein